MSRFRIWFVPALIAVLFIANTGFSASIFIRTGRDKAAEIQPEFTVTPNDASEPVFSYPQDDEIQCLSQAGQPQIPWKLMTVLLPPNADLTSVAGQTIAIQYESLGTGWTVKPMPPAATRDEQNNEIIIWPADRVIVDGKDIEIYQADAFWPYEETRVVQANQLRQWQLAEIAVPLVRYNPVTGELLKLSTADVNVDYKRKMHPVKAGQFKRDRSGRDRAGRLAVNFSDAVKEYEAATADTDESSSYTTYTTSESSLDAGEAGINSTGYAIITTNTLKNSSTKLASFIAHKQNRGFTVYVVTETVCTCTNTGVTSNGWNGGTGSISANNIRTWLKNNYLSKDLLYVLLIGNPNPDSGNVAMFKNHYATSEDDWAPTDYNYWFLNSDDGSDRYWEVIVGRIPNYDSSVTYLDSILQKTMDYENSSNTNWRRNVLLPMVPLDDSTPCYQLGEQIKANLLVSRVIPSYRIYEDKYDAIPPPEALLSSTYPATAWANGRYGLVSWQTHGNQDFAASVISSSDAGSLDNTYPAVTWQGSCLNAYAENSNNLAYRLLRQGAIVTHAATRNSWYYVGEKSFTNTSSNGGFAYKFADRILQGDTCGVALGTVRQTLTPGLWSNFTRYVIYGDPSVRPFYDMTNFTVSPTDAFYAMKTMGHSPSAASRTYTIKNNTSSAINWTATESADWFDLSSTSGSIAAGGSASVIVSFNNTATNTMPAGLNSDTILFTDTTNNVAYTRAVQLEVTTTMIGHWKLDDAAGSIASDSGPLSNSGTLADTDIDDTSVDPDSSVDNDIVNAMSFELNSTTGKLGTALMFDGMGDHIKLNNSVITPGPGFSVCLWAYPTAAGSWARFIDFGNGSSASNLLLARYSTTNDLVFESYNGSSGGGTVRAANAIELNKWQFFAATLDASGNVKIYKNGVEVASGKSAALAKVNHTRCYIGRSNWSSDAYYQGAMDDIRIFNTVLTEQQIQNLMSGYSEAYAPKPREHGGTSQQSMLHWSGSENAVGYQIYMGTDSAAVASAAPTSAEYMGYRTITQYNPGELTLGDRYYWRVDTVTSTGLILTGPVWDFLVVGTITRQVYTDITGEAVSNLTSAAKYPNSPDIYEQITSAEGPIDAMDYYGTRMEGFVTPKTSGTYYFYISGDDGTELWFSPNSSPSSSSRIAYSTAHTSSRQWTKYSSQKSSARTLVAGQKYYIRALQKEHGGGDHVAIGWQGPDSPAISVIDGQFLTPYVTKAAPMFSDEIITKAEAAEGRAYQKSLTSDMAVNGTFTYTKTAGPAWLQVSSAGLLSGTPANGDRGLTSILVQASDAWGRTDQAVFQVPVAETCNGGWGSSDLISFAEHWLDTQAGSPANLNADGIVNLLDLNLFAAHWQQDIQPGLAAHWTMNDIMAATLRDIYGGHDAALTNSQILRTAPGRLGNALLLDGVDDYAVATGFKGIGGTRARTCTAWIRTSAVGTEQTIVSWGNIATGQKWIFRLQSTGELAVGIWGAYINTRNALNDGRWHHVAAVSPDNPTPNVTGIKLYVDGRLQTNTIASNSLTVNTSLMDDVLIGNYTIANGSHQAFFKGQIDDVRLYNRALTDTEIAWLGQTYLVAHWPINEGQGTLIQEQIDQAHARTVNMDSTNWVAGRAGTALSFNGTDEYLAVTGFPGISGTASRTCSAWVKTVASGADQVILSWGTASAGQKWMFRVQPGGPLAVGVWNGYCAGDTLVSDNQWHHVTAVLNNDGSPSVNEIQLYVDGKLQTTSAINTQAIDTLVTDTLYIGAVNNNDSLQNFFGGQIENVQIYNRALTQEEIKDLAK
ncbi:MAG: hypothetical protein JXB18_07390 [Sedimentisphaerales bacterium]|nr:hypothetical protein [Sedimentisphaerales bacterium]